MTKGPLDIFDDSMTGHINELEDLIGGMYFEYKGTDRKKTPCETETEGLYALRDARVRCSIA